MTTGYNIRKTLGRAAQAKQQLLTDPGVAAGVIPVAPQELGVVIISVTGARTLEPAAQVPLGTTVFAISQVNGVTVNGEALEDGDAIEFIVSLNSSSAHEWRVRGTELEPYELPIAALEGTYDDTGDSAVIVIDLAETDGAVLALDVANALIQLSRALQDAGHIDLAIGEAP